MARSELSKPGRTFIVDAYGTEVLEVTGQDSIPSPLPDGQTVYIPSVNASSS
jgi:hypothetical protein